MFNIGEYVVYGTVGVCTVEDITTLDMRDVPKEKKYYVLVPLSTKSNRIFAPVDHTKVPMRKIITKDEAIKLIDSMPELEDIQIDNPKLTDAIYKETLKTCEVIAYARVIKTLYKFNKKRVEQGKKITASGEKFLRIAEDALYSELAIVLSIERNDVPKYIGERIGMTV